MRFVRYGLVLALTLLGTAPVCAGGMPVLHPSCDQSGPYGEPLPPGARGRLGMIVKNDYWHSGVDAALRNRLAFAADGKRVAAFAGTEVFVWETASAKLLRRWPAFRLH